MTHPVNVMLHQVRGLIESCVLADGYEDGFEDNWDR